MTAHFSDLGLDVDYPREMPPSEARRYALEAANECVNRPKRIIISTSTCKVEAYANGHFVKEWEV